MDAASSHDQFNRPTGAAAPREILAFVCLLIGLESAYFWDALRPGYVLSAADWLLATESFRESGAADYEPANRLLTDIACQMEPWMDLAGREWRAGRVPLWNPYAGCGAPLLANAQSGVFYPLNFVSFLTGSPFAWVVMAMVKLFMAGIGAFLFANELGLGRRGRWFAGLNFPFSGFVVVWLQYPMGSVAVWLPVLLWLTEKLVQRPGPFWTALLAASVGSMLLAGHPETAAHILILTACYVLWRFASTQPAGFWRTQRSVLVALRSLRWFTFACATGFLLAAVQLVPLAEYLQRSQAWSDRSGEIRSVWKFRKPDLLSMPALALPYVYGSYLRGHPHVEKALGVENFNEIAGGYTGLATIAVLVPLAMRVRRHRWISFWIAVDVVALAAIYRFPIVDNLLRIVPILNVTQNQRLLLVVSLAHCLLGGAGLDAWEEFAAPSNRRFRLLLSCLLAAAVIALVLAGLLVRSLAPKIRERAIEHFEKQAAARGLPTDALDARAQRQADQVVRFFPRYYLAIAVLAVGIVGMIQLAGRVNEKSVSRSMLLFSLADLFMFGRGYNPAIPLERYFPDCSVTKFLRDRQAQMGYEPIRVLSLEEEFPPNVLARYQIADLRNYDALEHRELLNFFSGLWREPAGRLTSTSWTTWDRVAAELPRLRLGSVRYIVTTLEPPTDFGAVKLVYKNGRVSVYELESATWTHFVKPGIRGEASIEEPFAAITREIQAGHLQLTCTVPESGGLIVIANTAMSGWRARLDGDRVPIEPYQNAFLSVPVPVGEHTIELSYEPASFRWGVGMSLCGLACLFGLAASALRLKLQRS